MLTPATDTTEDVVAYTCHLQRQYTDELGFLPKLAIRQYAQRNQILLTHENKEPCAYALYYDGRNGNRPRLDPFTLRIHQLCTQYDARRLAHATRLINQVYDIAKTGHFNRIRAWVAQDIQANDFWKAVGFQLKGTRQGGRRRNRLHNLWILDL